MNKQKVKVKKEDRVKYVSREEMMKIKKERRKIRKMKSMLFRLWFVKNWFTIFILLLTTLMIFTLAGVIPPSVPYIGEFSDIIKEKLSHLLMLNNNDYLSLFGAVSGLISLLFGIGFISSKIKFVSYSMIDKKKLEKKLGMTNMTINEKGTIKKLEEKTGIDIDGDNKVGDVPINIRDSDIFTDVVNTFSELVTISKLGDDELKEVIKEEKKEEVTEVVKKRPYPVRNKPKIL